MDFIPNIRDTLELKPLLNLLLVFQVLTRLYWIILVPNTKVITKSCACTGVGLDSL